MYNCNDIIIKLSMLEIQSVVHISAITAWCGENRATFYSYKWL